MKPGSVKLTSRAHSMHLEDIMDEAFTVADTEELDEVEQIPVDFDDAHTPFTNKSKDRSVQAFGCPLK